METTLFLVDLAVLGPDRLTALLPNTTDQKVFIARGNVGSLSFNTSLSEEEIARVKAVFDFEFVEYEEVKKSFLKYAHKFIVDSNDLLVQALYSDLNLQGRKDVQFLKFSVNDEAELLEELKHSSTVSITRIQALTEQVTDMKLLLSAFLSILTEEQKKQVNAVYAKSRQSVTETLNVSKNFIAMVSKEQVNLSIADALEKFGELLKQDTFLEASSQVLEKITEGSVENFEDYITTKRQPADIVNDRQVTTAVLIAYGQALNA